MIHLRLKNVTKRFGSTVAVDNVSLDVEKGSFTTLLGPSGCGKTTTLRMIAGFYDPDSGEIYIGERLFNGVPPYKRNTAMVFQEYALFPHMTVYENVAYGLKMKKVPKAEIQRKVEDVLDFLGLKGLGERRPEQLSGGQQQRVALARALVMEPEVLLLDEPLSNLDAKLRITVRTEIRQIQQTLGITTIYVTHDQEEALSISDKVAVMYIGKVVQVGTPLEIYYKPQNRFVADFIGLVNFVRGTVAQTLPKELEVDIGVAKLTLFSEDYKARPGEKVLLSIRPECIHLFKSLPGKEEVNVLRAKIKTRSFLGSLARYWLEVDGTNWIVDDHDPGPKGILDGEVYIVLEKSKIHIIPTEE